MTASNQKSIRVRAATRARLRYEVGPAGEAVESPLTTGTLGRPSPPAVRTAGVFCVSHTHHRPFGTNLYPERLKRTAFDAMLCAPTRAAIRRMPSVSSCYSHAITSGVLPPDQYIASLARKRMAAGALFRDEDGRVLLVDTTYKPWWELLRP